MTSISIIIPTYGREKQLSMLLERLANDRPPGSEIVVVSQDRHLLLSAKNSPDLHIVRLRYPSLPAARNAGIRVSSGAIVLFLDDDSVPMEHLAAVHLRLHGQHPQYAAVAGQVLDANNRGDKPAVVEFDTKTLRYVCDFGRNGHEDVDAFHGSHMSFKREVFDQVSFDPWFRGNALCEELDLAIRIRRRGLRILFSSEARTTHMLAPAGGCRWFQSRFRLIRHTFYNRAYCFFKNFGMRSIYPFIEAQKHELEYLSRRQGGHDAVLITAGLIGLTFGIAAGQLRRYMAPRRYR